MGAISDGKINWPFLVASYIGIPLFLATWLGYKWKHRTKLLKLEECVFDDELRS